MSPSEPSPQPPEPDGISLDELSAAFAQVMGRAAPAGEEEGIPPDAGGETAEPREGEQVLEEPEGLEPVAAADDTCEVSPLTILEAMLFVGNRAGEALTAARAAELMRGVKAEEIPGLIAQLKRRYADRGCPYEVVEEGVGYRLALREEFVAVRNKFYGRVREARLSQAAVDVLAIVAYQQPVTAEEVTKLRGAPSSALLTQLVRRRLLLLERPAGTPPQYRTTSRFLELFGLESLDDLPQTDDQSA
jgi:segregation and condensation protein B